MSARRGRRVLRVGVDFDNTLVAYDALFHRVALEQALIPRELPATKLAVREHLRGIGREDRWTELQGNVYGARMGEAEMYPGAREFLVWSRGEGLELSIVSHKTRYPFLGPPYDLHAAARAWVESALEGLVAPERVYFELTKEEKIRRIAELACDLYVDDLPEILQDAAFPAATERVLFDPESHHGDPADMVVAQSWAQIRSHVEGRWARTR